MKRGDHLLEGFMEAVKQDPVVSTKACCLYLVLLFEKNRRKAGSTLVVKRSELQRVIKVSRTTFQKAMGELEARGYIRYTASFHPGSGSFVTFYGFPEGLLEIVIRRDEILFVAGY